ncbi:monofunctional biosynthetic peptidoglycan transglycosylase [Albidovulum sp.]
MARGRKRTKKGRDKAAPAAGGLTLRCILHWLRRGALGLVALVLFLILLFGIVNPPITPYMAAESWRRGAISRDWQPIGRIAPVMARAVVAAEDANFCLHWGFDLRAIRAALDDGTGRGASTISQQVVKNVFLWHGRSWPRKALEALMTPLVELAWSKRRILEVYLNVAETGPGLFGVEAAARRYFGKGAGELTAMEAALIAAALPDPKGRNPARPSAFLRKRARAIADGAATIRADGRSACFEH